MNKITTFIKTMVSVLTLLIWQASTLQRRTYGVAKLEIDLIDLLHVYSKVKPKTRAPTLNVINYVYNINSMESLLRQSLINHSAWNMSTDWYIYGLKPMTSREIPDLAADLTCSLSYRLPDALEPSPFKGI